MEIKILGTRGEIEEEREGHKKHSGVLIDGFLFDLGEQEYLSLSPKAVFITHLHPDHAYFTTLKETPVELKEVPIYGPEQWDVDPSLVKVLDSPVEIEGYRITPVPTVHSKKVKSQGYLLEKGSKKVFYSGDLIWIPKSFQNNVRKCDVVILEASSLDKDLIRRNEEIYGHSSLKRLINLFKKLECNRFLTVHYGTWLMDDPEKGYEAVKNLDSEVEITPCRDGYMMELQLKPEDVEPITPKVVHEIKRGLYLTEPHGRLIWEGKKDLIVKSKKFEGLLNEDLYLISNGFIYGIIRLEKIFEIQDMETFRKLRNRHQIEDSEFEKWKWNFPLYGYEFSFRRFDTPLPVKVPRGVQETVDVDNLKFLTPKEMDNVELELYHAICHSYPVEALEISFLHSDIVSEMEERSLRHVYRGSIDRVHELIKGSFQEYVENISRIPDAVLRDDWRIVLAWYSSLKEGKTLKRRDGSEITPEDCKTLATAIVQEMLKRGFQFSPPSTYKEHSRELFEWVVDQIGRDKFSWKEESLDIKENLNPEDITVDYVKSLSNRELEDLWVWLHEKWMDQEGPDKVSEGFLNANIIVQTERFKRGLIDESYEDRDLLDRESRFAWQEYPMPVLEHEPEEITLEQVLDAFSKAGHIVVKGFPFASYLTGRIVNLGKIPKDHDIDLALRQDPDPRLIFALKRIKPDWLAKRLHPFFDKQAGAIGYSVPIHGYSLNPLPKELMVKGFHVALEEIKLGKYIIGVKPKSGFGKFEFFEAEDLWKNWGVDHIDNGVLVQEKLDGRRLQCVKEGTIIFSSTPLPVEQIKPGASLLAADGMESEVKYAFARRYVGELIKIKSRGITVSLTPEHPVLAVRHQNCKFPSKKDEWICSPKCMNKCISKPRGFTPQWIPARDLQTKDWLLIPKIKLPDEDLKLTFKLKQVGQGRRFFLNDEVPLDDELLGLLGWFIAEGSANKHWGNISFALGFKEQKEAEWISNTLSSKFGLRPKIRSRNNGLEVYCRSKSVASFFNMLCGKGAKSKHLPSFWRQLSKRQLKVLLNALLRGDGNYIEHTRTWALTTASPTLAHQVFELLLGLGTVARIHKNPQRPSKFQGRTINGSEIYRVTWEENHREVYEDELYYYTHAEVSRETYDGVVYNFETSSSNYCLPFIVHNCHIYDDKVQIFTEDTHRDRASLLPEIVEELRGLKLKNAILDGELLVFDLPSGVTAKNARTLREIGDLVPREDTAVLTGGKEIPKEIRDRAVYTFYDILYLNGEDLTKKTAEERFEILSKLIPRDCKHLDVVRGEKATDMKSFLRLVSKYRSLNGSEGVVVKDALSTYPVKFSGENRTEAFAKLKNLKEIDVIVLDIVQKKTKEGTPLPTWMYICGYEIPAERKDEFYGAVKLGDKWYAPIGKSYGTGEKASIGDIVTVVTIRVRKYERDGKIAYTWMFPIFKEIRRDKKEADTLTTVERLAKIGTRPLPEKWREMSLEDLEDADVVIQVRLQKCPYFKDWDICPLRKRFGIQRALARVRVEEEVLRFPVICPLTRIFKCPFLKSVAGDRPIVVKGSDPEILTFEEFWNALKIPVYTDGVHEVKDLRGLDLETVDAFGNWVKLKAILRHPYSGPLVHLTQKWGETVITDNHSIISSEGIPSTPDGEILAVREIKLPSKDSFEISCPSLVTYNGYLYHPRKRSKPLKPECREHGVKGYCPSCTPWMIKAVYESEDDIKALLRVLAAYITVGSISITNKTYFTVISQKDREYLEDVLESLNRIGNLRPSLYCNKDKWVLEMTNPLIGKLLIHLCGRGSHHKKIPSFIFTLRDDLKRFFFNELLRGDGTRAVQNGRVKVSFFTTSKKLAAGLSLLLSSIGQMYTFNVTAMKGIGRFGTKGYLFQLVDSFSSKCTVQRELVDYTGYVYDLETETGSFTDAVGMVGLHNSYYYSFQKISEYDSELEDGDMDLELLSAPSEIRLFLLQKYMQMKKGERDFVMQSHILSEEKDTLYPKRGSQHLDFRFNMNGYLEGWSIVGGSVDDPITPERLLENKGKGFRAEVKASQPLVWMKVGEKRQFVEVGRGEPRGVMEILTKGKLILGVQKAYFHEYFVKDGKHFKDWTRIVIRAVNVPVMREKVPEEGHKERMWRFMIPVDQTPYAISDRAIEKNYVPPKSHPYPFPLEWTKEHFPEQFKKWEEYMKNRELSKIRYTFSQHSYRGPIHVRGMWKRTWYLFLEDQPNERVRVFRIENFLPIEKVSDVYDEGRERNSVLKFEGKTKPQSRFNPNKKLVGEMKILSSGYVDYDVEEVDGREIIKLRFKDGLLEGSWIIEQEEEGSEVYSIRQELQGRRFVYHKHILPSGSYHYDLRWESDNIVEEFNLYGDLSSDERVVAVRKTCEDPSWLDIVSSTVKKRVGNMVTEVVPVDHGSIQVLESNPDFLSFRLNGRTLRGFFIAKRENRIWVLSRGVLPTPLEGDPSKGPYRDFVIEEKRGWDHFNVYLYDPREFTRFETAEKSKEYLDIDIPEGVTVYIGLYPIPGRIHHARVGMVQFKKETWNYDKAEKWIRENNLHVWKGVQLREKT